MKRDTRPHKIIIVANRLPVSISKRKENIRIQQSPGGLAAGLRTLREKGDVLFVGWPGYWPAHTDERKKIENMLINQHQSYPVFIEPSEVSKYYYGFANRTLWPLFHYFSTYSDYDQAEWAAYARVNERFLQKIYALAGPEDTIWIHDYHLMLLPSLIRKSLPRSALGFFLHIPFPSSEIFRTLPWRREILEGLLGADLIGFHTYEYARHFLSSVLRLLGLEHEFGTLNVDYRMVKVENFPMGIDVRAMEGLLMNPATQKDIQDWKQKMAAEARKIILSVDRLDYTKGIPQRLAGFETFLERHPQWHNRFIYVMLCVPSRTRVQQYSLLREEVDRMVGRINGRFGQPGWIPIHYMYRSLPFEKLISLYAVADMALITPLRDGMNLVAKEFVASRINQDGVLVLSETAGAASELAEAVQINVNSREEIAGALLQSLEMDKNEQKKRISVMRKRLADNDILHWMENFLDRVKDVKTSQARREHKKLDRRWKEKLFQDFAGAANRLLLLDYDGTLVPFSPELDHAHQNAGLSRILKRLAADRRTELVILSGRSRTYLEKHLGNINCGLVAEHGSWIRKDASTGWQRMDRLSISGIDLLKPVFRDYEVRVPGSLTEEKEYGIAWHYRRADPELGRLKANELFDYLSEYLANTDLHVMQGNKVIEVRASGVDKGHAVVPWISAKKWDFILAVGDDWTDEDLFKALPADAYTVKVSYGHSNARFYLESPESSRKLLLELSKLTG